MTTSLTENQVEDPACPVDHGRVLREAVAMVESVTAIQNLPEILAVAGIDVFFIGPSDLSHSIGLAGQLHHPDVKVAVKQAAATIRAAGKVPGTLVIDSTAAEFVEAGCRYLYEHANNFLAAGAHVFRQQLAGATREHGR